MKFILIYFIGNATITVTVTAIIIINRTDNEIEKEKSSCLCHKIMTAFCTQLILICIE